MCVTDTPISLPLYNFTFVSSILSASSSGSRETYREGNFFPANGCPRSAHIRQNRTTDDYSRIVRSKGIHARARARTVWDASSSARFSRFSLTMSVIRTREVNSWQGGGECGPFPNRGWLGGWSELREEEEEGERGWRGRERSIEGANVPRAGNAVSILHPLSLRLLSPIFIRLYLRLESVPLHFLSRSSFSSSRPAIASTPPPPTRHRPPARPFSRHSTFSPPGVPMR